MFTAAQATKYVVAVDESKLCERLGVTYPIPVEVAPFYAQRTVRAITALPSLAPCDAQLRYGDAPTGFPGVGSAKPFVTDNGNLIVDVRKPALFYCASSHHDSLALLSPASTARSQACRFVPPTTLSTLGRLPSRRCFARRRSSTWLPPLPSSSRPSESSSMACSYTVARRCCL